MASIMRRFEMTLLASVLLFSLVVSQTKASEEDLSYIKTILAKLNNNERCQLPTYEEIDTLQEKYDHLSLSYANDWLSSYDPDYKLAHHTILDQWTSFQRHLTSASVTKSAKKRAFLGKVEQYQVEKFGFSICTQTPEVLEEDSEYEKNPLVRYVKHVGADGQVVDAPAASEGAAGEQIPAAAAADDDDSKAVAPKGDAPNAGNNPVGVDPLGGADVVFKFKVPSKDPQGSTRTYGGNFMYRDGRVPHRITLDIHP